MRSPAAKRRESTPMGLNMTSMIDVVFLLLIFFVCTTSFESLEELLPTTLRGPGATALAQRSPELQDLEDVTIHIALVEGAPRWEINGTAYDEWRQVRQILAELAGLQANLPVILNVRDDVPLGDMIDVYDACRVVGFSDVRFAARE